MVARASKVGHDRIGGERERYNRYANRIIVCCVPCGEMVGSNKRKSCQICVRCPLPRVSWLRLRVLAAFFRFGSSESASPSSSGCSSSPNAP